MGKIESYRDLTAWKKSHKLVLHVYRITSQFPKAELFGLVSQMRRCAVSVVSNIVEGFARRGTKEKTQFYYHSKSSLVELQSQLEISKDLGFVSSSGYIESEKQIVEIQKIISGLIRNQKERL